MSGAVRRRERDRRVAGRTAAWAGLLSLALLVALGTLPATAFPQSGELRIAQEAGPAEGTAFGATSGAAQATTANGRVAFVSRRDGDQEIYAMNPDGSTVRRLTDHPAADSEPAWSPDGTKLAFVSRRDGNDEIHVMNADGSNVTRLVDNAGGVDDHEPAWSPDGARIAFSSDRGKLGLDLWVMDADGSDMRQLTEANGTDSEPAWSPDGTKIAFNKNSDVWTMDPDGAGQTNLTNSPDRAEPDAPAWSPDGTKIAYTSYTDGVIVPASQGGEATQQEEAAPPGVWVMDAGGSGKALLVEGSAYHPAWSPDGARIAFMQYGEDGDAEVRSAAADGTGPAGLTDHPAWDGDPAWGTAPPLAPVASPQPPTIALAPGSDTGASATDGLTNDPTPTLEGSAEPGSTVAVYDDGRLVGSAAANDSGTWSLTTPRLYDWHRYDLRAVATGAEGGVSRPSGVLAVRVDTVGPKVYTQADAFSPRPDEAGVPVGADASLLLWQEVDPQTVDAAAFTLVRAGTAAPLGAAVRYDPTAHRATLDPSADLAAGATYRATVAASIEDLAGNPMGEDFSWSFTTAGPVGPPDALPPDTSISSGPAGHVKGRTASFGFSSAEDGAVFECSLDGAAYSACSSPESYSELRDGRHAFRMRAVDAAGNADATPAERAWTVDTVKPAVGSPSPAGCSSTRDRTPLVGATVRDSRTDLARGDVRLYLDGRSITAFSYDRAANRLRYEPSRGLSYGPHALKVVARDAAGNVGTKSWSFKVVG